VHITVRCPGDPDSVVHAVQETLARVVRIPVVVTVEDFAVE
jgi:2'-5' RNA ligase